ncbi:MAG: succinate dehydrogenase cytochrome b subunit [Syntrophorhabdaceae bacterium]|nr:succinate dehydrogenase cytochrome b subunit [Syntrophorhabdaceae bacterium]
MIGRKALVAATGVVMLLFVLAHSFGALSVFTGPNGINAYAQALQNLGPLLLAFRAVMVFVLILHVTFAIMVTATNWKAKPDRYAVRRTRVATFAGETMLWSGLLLLAFIVCHILQFTLHATPDVVIRIDAQGRLDVFAMMRESLRLAPVSIAYLIAMSALFLHLFHGIQSVSQTIGLLNEKTKPMFQIAGITLSTLLLLGYGTIPLMILAGMGVFGK